MSRWGWTPYVPVSRRKANAKKEMEKLRKKGQCVMPVEIAGRTIARSFWGKAWCTHLESFSDYENRLPRGRTYVRNGSVCHLEIREGEILAMVNGSELYTVHIAVTKLPAAKWTTLKSRCTGQVGSLLELIQGKLSAEVMTVVAHRTEGLFPLPGEMKLDCSCPDWATMCKHVAAVLYGVGHRFDTDPGLLFTLRGVDPQELITAPISLMDGDASRPDTLADADLADLFGIDVELEPASPHSVKASTPKPSEPAPFATTSPAKAAPKSRPATTKSATSSTSRPTGTKPKPFSPTGPNIKKLRRKMNLTVDEFAARIGASPATIRRWEDSRGKCKLQTRLMEALCELHATGQ
ncbi:MAG: SWIM zinc finger family protein [Desulfomicrobium apsheronum]|nr:SWIM zinc finger family protein [Desulfomicrobium apsheronum]